MRRPLGALGVLGACVAVAVLGPSTATAVQGPGVSVTYPSGSAFITPGQLAANVDVPRTTYTLRATPDEEGQRITLGGTSARRVIQLAGADVDQFGYVTVPRSGGTTAYLPTSDFAQPHPFADGPALVFVDQDSTHFFRPVRGPRDVNAKENIATVSGVALALGLHDGALLEVEIEATPTKTKPGRKVAFSATATGALGREQLSYAWRFDDGTTGTGAKVSHAFARPGGYEVSVTVTGSRDSGGASDPVTIVVGNPPKNPGNGSGNGPDGASGPAGSGGERGAGSGQGSGEGSGGAAAGSGGPGSGEPASRAGEPAADREDPATALERISGTAISLGGETTPAIADALRASVAAAAAAAAGGSESSTSVDADPEPASAGVLEAGILLGMLLVGAGAAVEWRRPRDAR